MNTMQVNQKVRKRAWVFGCLALGLTLSFNAMLLSPMPGMAAPTQQTTATADARTTVEQLIKTGDAQADKRQFAPALKSYQQALELAGTLDNPRTTANLLGKIGRAYRQLEQF